MESRKFDDLARGTVTDSSRRGVLRVGFGALAASALATLGPRADDADAKKKKKKKKTICNCTSSDPLTCSTQKTKKNKANDILNSNPCAYSGSCQAGLSGCPAQCAADRPVVCGEGCCPAEFSKCCDDVENPLFTKTCNPTSFTCCPASAGGGSCDPEFPQCCPLTTQDPEFGHCTEATSICCTSETGGNSCLADFPVCCLIDPADLESGNCCPVGSSCCTVDADCPGGGLGACDLMSNCCNVGPREARAASRGGNRRGGKDRFHMVAK